MLPAQGEITLLPDGRYQISGKLNRIDDETIEITELPIRKWTTEYKAMLEAAMVGGEKTQATIKVGLPLRAARHSGDRSCRG